MVTSALSSISSMRHTIMCEQNWYYTTSQSLSRPHCSISVINWTCQSTGWGPGWQHSIILCYRQAWYYQTTTTMHRLQQRLSCAHIHQARRQWCRYDYTIAQHIVLHHRVVLLPVGCYLLTVLLRLNAWLQGLFNTILRVSLGTLWFSISLDSKNIIPVMLLFWNL